MATTLNSPAYVSDWLKGEGESGEYFSRDTGVLTSGQGVLVTGTVLAQTTATGKWVVAAATGSDGSQTATGILITAASGSTSVDATSADQPIVVLTRHATVSHQGLVWGSTINSPSLRAAAAAQLAQKGIIDRQGA